MCLYTRFYLSFRNDLVENVNISDNLTAVKLRSDSLQSFQSLHNHLMLCIATYVCCTLCTAAFYLIVYDLLMFTFQVAYPLHIKCVCVFSNSEQMNQYALPRLVYSVVFVCFRLCENARNCS